MKLRTNWPLYILLLLFAVLGLRCAWVLTRSVTGWYPYLSEWSTLATGLVGIETVPLSNHNPKEQARFWLKQVAEVEAVNQDPEVAMGAAWMLDEPQPGYLLNHVTTEEGWGGVDLPVSTRRKLDEETIEILKQEFESLCRDACLENIETATRLDPDNVELWRARALLLFQNKKNDSGWNKLTPRSADWLAVLDECAVHDPANALYDYLAASHLKLISSKTLYPNDVPTLKVIQPEVFARAQQRYRSGLKKPFLKFGTIGYPATLSFLAQTSIPQLDQINATGSRRIYNLCFSLFIKIMRWQDVLYETEMKNKNGAALLAILQNKQKVIDQVVIDGNHENALWFKRIFQTGCLAKLLKIQKLHPHVLTQTETKQIAEKYAEAQLNAKIYDEVSKRFDEKSEPKNWTSELNIIFLTDTSQIFVVVCLALALLTGFVGWIFGTANDSKQVKMGWTRQVIAWLLGLGISFVLWGLCPAEIISTKVQTWFIPGFLWLGFTGLLLGALFLIRRIVPLPRTQLTALFFITVLPIVLYIQLSVITDWGYRMFLSLPVAAIIILPLIFVLLCLIMFYLFLAFVGNDELSRRQKYLSLSLVLLLSFLVVPTTTKLVATTSNEEGLRAWFSPVLSKDATNLFNRPHQLKRKLNLEDSNWTWALIQWHTHKGVRFTVVLTLLILIGWSFFRQARSLEGGYRELFRAQKRTFIRETGYLVSSSFVVAAITFSLFTLATTPSIVADRDRKYLLEYPLLANPLQISNEVKTLTFVVKSDESTMLKLKAEIAESNRERAEHEKWLEENSSE